MARILIGNIKGPAGKIVSVSATKGEPGTDPQVTNVGTESDAKLQFVIPEGQKGEQGLQGPTGPMPPLVNNLTTNQAGQGALDAAQGKALADKDTALQSAVDTLNRNTSDLESRLTIITSGSFKDISKSGIYYVSNSVTDKPDSTGGLYLLSYFDNVNNIGLYISANSSINPIVCAKNEETYRIQKA